MFGVLRSVWVARKPPGYAFIEFDDHRDALDAIQRLDGKNGWRVELSHNSKGGGGGGGGGRGRCGGVEDGEVLPLNVAVEVPVMMVMGAGLIVHAGEDLLLLYDVAPHHLLFDVDATSAGLPHTAMLDVFHLMPMGTELELDLSKCWMDVEMFLPHKGVLWSPFAPAFSLRLTETWSEIEMSSNFGALVCYVLQQTS
ncbi:hypothetical protein ACLB2K_036234 [Fragaria x ananassa]